MFITSFGEQNITYKCCSNFLIHLYGESFLYHNVCPKLQIHGLVENEKVTGVKYRRFAMTKKGTEFLAYLQKQKILKV